MNVTEAVCINDVIYVMGELNHLLQSWELPIILHEPIDQTVQRIAKYVQIEGRDNYND